LATCTLPRTGYSSQTRSALDDRACSSNFERPEPEEYAFRTRADLLTKLARKPCSALVHTRRSRYHFLNTTKHNGAAHETALVAWNPRAGGPYPAKRQLLAKKTARSTLRSPSPFSGFTGALWPLGLTDAFPERRNSPLGETLRAGACQGSACRSSARLRGKALAAIGESSAPMVLRLSFSLPPPHPIWLLVPLTPPSPRRRL
jgi:hypothetical protein